MNTTSKRQYYTDKVHNAVLHEALKKRQEPIIYHEHDGSHSSVRNGFLISDEDPLMVVRLIGDLGNTRIWGDEREYVTLVHQRRAELDAWREEHRQAEEESDGE